MRGAINCDFTPTTLVTGSTARKAKRKLKAKFKVPNRSGFLYEKKQILDQIARDYDLYTPQREQLYYNPTPAPPVRRTQQRQTGLPPATPGRPNREQFDWVERDLNDRLATEATRMGAEYRARMEAEADRIRQQLITNDYVWFATDPATTSVEGVTATVYTTNTDNPNLTPHRHAIDFNIEMLQNYATMTAPEAVIRTDNV
jgi:hypothetical protein